MRTTIIPAQITTVEDKIVGSLTLTQILILTIPVFTTAAVYILLPPTMELSLYKLPPIALVATICIVLSLRIKNIIVLDWLLLITHYYLRPRMYIFDKNDVYVRMVEKNKSTPMRSRVHLFNMDFANRFKKAPRLHKPSIQKKRLYQDYIDIDALTIQFNKRKGGLNVAFEHVTK